MKSGFASLCAKDIKSEQGNPSHVLPLIQSAAFDFETVEQGISIFESQSDRQAYVYSRYDNPTVKAVAEKIAGLESYDLEQTAQALMFSSGMAALTTLCLGVLSPGEVILASTKLYGGSTELLNKILHKSGIVIRFIDFTKPEKVAELLKSTPSARLLFYESPANPGLECIDMTEIDRLAKTHKLLHVVDNTISTPYYQRPFNFGADVIIHSTTKYLNGHGTAIGGIIISRDRDLVNEKVWPALKLMGTNPSPFDVWMLHHGLKTLTLRMDKQSANAMKVASFLESHPKIEKVNYLGLKSHPSHELATKQMSGFGGLLSFYLKGDLKQAISFMNALEFCSLTPTLGDVDTLVLHPATSSHINVDYASRAKAEITDNLVRLSAGIEDPEDIITDLSFALDSMV